MTFDGIEKETGAQPRHAVIWLHGLGADGNDFSPMVPQLVARDWPPLRFVFPHAPMRAITINGGMRMRGWYDITGMEIAQRQDEVGVRASITLVEDLIAREVARDVPASNIILAGFSQGAAMALSAGLRHAATLAGIVALSGYLPLHEQLDKERSAGNADTRIFMGHGSFDPVVPQALGMMGRDYLRSLGYSVDWHSYGMAHQVCNEEIDQLRSWMAERLGLAAA